MMTNRLVLAIVRIGVVFVLGGIMFLALTFVIAILGNYDMCWPMALAAIVVILILFEYGASDVGRRES